MFIDEVVKKYPEAKNFDGLIKIDNIINYILSCPKDDAYSLTEDGLCLVPPFETTWFEGKIPTWHNGYAGIFVSCYDKKKSDSFMPVDKFIEFIGQSHYGDFIEDKYNHEYLNREIRRIIESPETRFVVAFTWFFSIEGIVINSGDRTLFLNSKGEISSAAVIDKGEIFSPESFNKELFSLVQINPEEADISLGYSYVIIMALNLLHCKNVSFSENNLPQKLIKARMKKNKPFFEKYYTLEIESIKKILNNAGANKNGMRQALHICRGHFKTYDDKKLFGKYKGTFWWPNYVRGNDTQGIVGKDYSLKL